MLDKAGQQERWGIVKKGGKGRGRKKHYIVYYGLILLKETNKPVYIYAVQKPIVHIAIPSICNCK
jgi:hypothetical protein